MTLSRWNPFGPLRSPRQAVLFARAAAVPAAITVLNAARGVWTLWNNDTLAVSDLTVASAVFTPLALLIVVPAFLAWWIWARQATWAAVTLMVLYGLGAAATVLAGVVTGRVPHAFGIALLLLSLAVVGVSIRACAWLTRRGRVPDLSAADEFA